MSKERSPLQFGWRLCTIVALLIVTTEAHAASQFKYTILNDEVVITGYEGELTELVIPEEIDGMPVTEIGDKAFYNNRNLKSVSIPDDVRRINQHAFSGNHNLMEVKLPSGLKIIEDHAFHYCINLRRVTLPEGLLKIGQEAFRSCPLSKIVIPTSVTEIASDGKVTLFERCDDLEAIHVAQGNPNFSSRDGVLYNKDETVLLKFPEAMCANFLVTPNIINIEPHALAGKGLKAIAVAEGNPFFASSAGVLLSKDGSTLLRYPGGIVGPAIIPESVTRIGEAAFVRSSGLTSVELPDRIVGIGPNAFAQCWSLRRVRLPQGLDVIEKGMFMECRKLSEVVIPESVLSIRSQAFFRTSLKKVILPNKEVDIEASAFDPDIQIEYSGGPSQSNIGETIPESASSGAPQSNRQETDPSNSQTPSQTSASPLHETNSTSAAPVKGDIVTLAEPATMPVIVEGRQAGSVRLPAGRQLIFLESKADGTALVKQSSNSQPFHIPRSVIQGSIVDRPPPAAPPAPISLLEPVAVATNPVETQPVAKATLEAQGQFFIHPPTILDGVLSPPKEVEKKKILILPDFANLGEQVALARLLEQAGHHVEHEKNIASTQRKIDGKEILRLETEIFSSKEVDCPKLEDYDLIVSGNEESFGSALSNRVRAAVDRGQLVLLYSDEGPWFYLPSGEATRSAEKEYLASQVAKKLLHLNSLNSTWEQAPWHESTEAEQMKHHQGLARYSGTKERSVIRPTDVVQGRNIITYHLPISDPSSLGYQIEYYPDEDKRKGTANAFRIEFAERALFPALQHALATHVATPMEFTPPQLQQVHGVPRRPELPWNFPLSRPDQEGEVVAWGFAEGLPGTTGVGIEERRQEIEPPKGLRAVQVATSESFGRGSHSLALKAEGTVVAWGDNEHGQCDVPLDLRDVVQVVAGSGVSAAVKSDGTVATWGTGRVAKHIPADLREVVKITFPYGSRVLVLHADGTCRLFYMGKEERNKNLVGAEVVDIMGDDGGLVLLTDGSVRAIDTGSAPPCDLGQVAALARSSDGASHYVVLQIDGTLRGWGRNDGGQATVPASETPFRFVAINHNNGAAIGTDGSISLWGSNWEGQKEIPDVLAKRRFIAAVPGRGYFLAILKD